MDTTWRLLDSGLCGAFYNMALDEAVAVSVRNNCSPPTLRLYGWDRPAISLGCFQKAAEIDTQYCRDVSIPVVRRPTGGRAILHGDELTYSFSARTDKGPFSKGLLDSYRKISAAFYLAFNKIGISAQSRRHREKGSVLAGSPLCFRSSSYGEILAGDKKLLGSAQKRWEDSLLQQGCVPYSLNRTEMCKAFGVEEAAVSRDCMTAVRELMPLFDEEGFKNTVRVCFEEVFGVRLVLSPPGQDELSLARELEETKYLLEDWNFRL